MVSNSPGQQLNDLLVTRNFDPDALDARTGKPPLDDQGAPDPDSADMFTFDWVADSGKNYGTVVCLLGADNNFEVYFGDNLGRGMDFDDKADWYEFLDQLRNFAKRNLLRYDLQNLRRLKYTMAGMAAIKEGLFEGYYGNRKISYAGEPTQARLMIKHNRTLDENDARFRYVESLFIETADGERFKLPFKKLAGGRAMLEHVRHGGTPYDARGQHISEMVDQINVLSQFRRAHQGRVFEGAAGELVAETTEYLNRLRHNLKAVANDRGYTQYFESWSPADVSESDLIVEDLKSLFVETRIDPRIEQALPMLAKIQKEALAMKEAEIFESWANRIVEGTWSLPETPEQQDELKMLMSQPLAAGADGMNATEQLYGLVGDDELFNIINDIADEQGPDVNVWDDSRVQNRLEQLGVFMVTPAEPAQSNDTPPVSEGEIYDLEKEYGAPAPAKKPRVPGETIPWRHPDEPDFMDPDQRRIRADQERVAKAQAEYLAKKKQGVAEGLGYSQDPEQAKWYHEGRKAFKYGTTAPSGLIQDIAKKHGVPAEWLKAFHAGYQDQEGWGKDHVDEGDNLSTFEDSGCNMTAEGEYCPEHGLEECGNYGMYESELARIKSLASVTNEGWKGTLAGSAAGGIAGDMAGAAVGPAAGAMLGGALGGPAGAIAGGLAGAAAGPAIGSAIGGLAGGKIGDKLGGQEVDEEDDSAITSTAKKIGSTAGDIYNIPGNIASAFANKVGKEKTDEEGTPLGKENPGTGQALGSIGGALAGGSAGAMLGGALGKSLDETDVDEESDTAKIVKGAAKAATQGLGDLVSSSGKEIAKNMLALESNSDSALLARIKSLALLK